MSYNAAWKKILWRAVRGVVYGALSGFLAVKGALYGIAPEVTTALAVAIFAAMDKAMGFGDIVKP